MSDQEGLTRMLPGSSQPRIVPTRIVQTPIVPTRIVQALAEGFAVPDFRGLAMSQVWPASESAGVTLELIRLTDRPAPAEGVVKAQDPPPGAPAWGGRVRLWVWHPPRSDAGSPW